MVSYKTLHRWNGVQIKFAVIILVCLFAGLFALTNEQTSSAATTLPTKMNFQGRLTNTAGNILANGTYNMRFKIWSAASGGTQQWAEDRLVSATQGVTVTNGQFSVQLGSVTSLPASIFASNSLYFEVELPTPASATTSSPVWTELPMTPRNQLVTSAYAYNSETLDGIDGDSFAQLGAAGTFTAAQNINVSNANAFQVRNGATNLFNIATSTNTVTVGASDTTGALLVLDTKTDAGDPTGANGAMYYNSNAGMFRCYQAGAWVNCITPAGGSATLQDVYNNSTAPATITTTAAGKSVKIAASVAPTVDLFSVDNTGQAATTADANGIQVDYVGGAAAVEGSGGRINLTPGTTSGGTWNGLKIVASATGAVSGVAEYGINLDGPTTPGAGTEVAISIDANWDAGIEFESKNSGPTWSPAAGNLVVYAQKYASRSLLSQKSSSSVSFAYQPAFFEQAISIANPNTGATIQTIGTPWTIDTTASTPAPTEAYGVHTNYATAATAADTAGLYHTTAQYFRGSVANGSNGFFSVSRVGMSDASYGTGATGARIWVGMSNQTTGLATADSVAAGHYAGFQYSTNRGDTNWMFLTNANSTHAAVSTGMAFTAAKVYDFFVYTPPQGTIMYWEINNITDGTMQEGSTTTSIPGTTTALRPGVDFATLTTTARNIKVNRVYVETDR